MKLRNILVVTSACLYLLAASCIHGDLSTVTNSIVTTGANDTEAAAWQRTVDAMLLLPVDYPIPQVNYNTPDSVRLAGWFDVHEYFAVLDHLSMEPGYVLDYLYHVSGSGAQPYLYAREINSPPFHSLTELVEKRGAAVTDLPYDYLKHVQTDGTSASFFQYVVLRILGGQFYLWWHANYNDRVIICARDGLENLFSETDSFAARYGQSLSPEFQNAARQLALAPMVQFNRDMVTVSVVVFTKWGGFIGETYTISRAFPHVIRDITTKTLLSWHINLTF